MARLIKKTDAGIQEVVEITVDKGSYRSSNEMIHHNCNYCKEFYMLPDNITPRVYKLSELKSGYMDRKNPEPHLSPLHPNCFLTTDGKVLTDKGFKQIKYIKIGDMVLNDKMQFKKVINTMNWDMSLYRKDFYSVKLQADDKRAIFVTPDHQLGTLDGMKAIKDIDPSKDFLIKLVCNCIMCGKSSNYQYPKLFCNYNCRNRFFEDVVENAEKLSKIKYKTESYKPTNLIWSHKPAEPTFLHDISVEGENLAEDGNFFINGILTKNCRCLMISVYPGFGFKAGKLEYISENYSEYDNQKIFRKSIDENFLKHNCREYFV